MKLFNMLLLATALLTSCNKEVSNCDSNCGWIIDDPILSNGCYSLEIKNDCTNNTKTFCFTADIWMNAFIGEYFCVQGETW